MTKNLKIGLIVLFIFQVIVAANFELAHDEAYYWLFSKKLAWGYFDHPPMVALIIKLFSIFPVSELSVRFGFILLQFVTIFLLLDLVPKEARLKALLLFLSFPLASFVGLLALPDMPLLFMSALYCWMLRKFLERESFVIAGLMGITIMALLLSKYHGILLIFFTLMAIPGLFKRKDFYFVVIMTMLLCLPHLQWQMDAEFITLKYHLLERPKSTFSFMRSLEFIGIQVLLGGAFLGPIVWWILLKHKSQSQFERAMKFISIGSVIFFLVSSFSKKVEANWTVFLAVPMIVLVADLKLWDRRWARNFLVITASFILLARILFILPSDAPGPKRLKEFKGWKKWSQEIVSSCQAPLLANTYQMASKLSFYLDLPIHSQNFHSRLNQFTLWDKDPSYYQGEEVCYLSDNRQFKGLRVTTPDGKDLYLVPKLSLREFSRAK